MRLSEKGRVMESLKNMIPRIDPASIRKGWKYSEKPLAGKAIKGYVYMGRVPDPKKGKGTQNTVRAYAPSTKLKTSSTKKYAKGSGVRKAQ
jgi:hypothetical protein